MNESGCIHDCQEHVKPFLPGGRRSEGTRKMSMSERIDLHCPPRRPHAWLWGVVVLHVLVACVWWRFGWVVGVVSLVAVHLVFVWGTLRAQSGLFGPVLVRLPTDERVVWLTIDDGPSAETAAMR